MSNNKYIISLTIASIFLFTLVVLINFSVDPLVKFRLSEHIYYSAERELKPRLLQKGSYDGIILGNSKVTYIQTGDISRHEKILNAGFSAATIEEIRYFLEEMNPKVKWVGIGLDFFMFNSAPPYKIRNGKYFNNISIPDQVEYLVSTDTLRYSLKSISKYIRGVRQRYTPLGARNRKHLESGDREKYNIFKKSIIKMRKNSFLNYKYSERRMEELKTIQQWADLNNIILVAWVNPYEGEVLKIIQKNINGEVDVLLEKMGAILSNFVDLSKKYQSAENFWKRDPIHFYPSTGEKLFSDYIFPMIKSAQKQP